MLSVGANGDSGEHLTTAQADLCDSRFESCLDAESTLTLLPPSPGVAGEINDFITLDGSPGTNVVLYLGGVGTSPVTVGPCTTFVDVRRARFFDTGPADENGEAVLSRRVPEGFRGVPLRIQALDVRSCTVSNLVETVFE
ncbi:MAG: hypothetical protein AAF184_09515 [Pseudomonadota bacterium]